MITVVVVIHLIVAMVMIGLILLQKTEGNAAGGGFSANASLSSAMQPRARPNPLSQATVVLGIAFFATSLGLAILAKATGPAPSLFTPAATDASSGPAPRVDEIRTTPADAPAPAVPAVPGASGTPAPSFNAPAAAPAPAQSGAPQVPNN
jgi:preprotein translocase subunit SecG